MKLITEQSLDCEYVVEERNNEKHHYIFGRYIVGEEKNKNGRVYPMKILEPAVEKYVTEFVNDKRAWGQLGHPSGPSIDPTLISHRITELKRRNNVYEGKSLITNTINGNLLKGLLECGGKVGVSTRGMGSLIEKNGAMEVQGDFKISAVDVVTDPSAPNCFVNGIMEGVEYFYDPIKESWKEERVEQIKDNIKKMSKSEIEENALNLFEEYFSLLIKN
jgi:hypothetical protein